MYVDSEVGRQNDMSIFDVLEEKVYVLDQDTQDVLWENHAEEAATNVSRQVAMPLQNEENKAAADLNQSNVSCLLPNKNELTYAIVEPEILKDELNDTVNVIQAINCLNEFETFAQILNKNIANKFEPRKNTYKLGSKNQNVINQQL